MPELATRTFHLGDILTVTTGCFVTPNGVDALYALLNWMTGDNLLTHQLMRAGDEAAPRLLEQHPDLAGIRVPAEWSEGEVSRETVMAWLDEQVSRYGETRDVAPMAAEDHTLIDPITEFAVLRTTEETP